MGVCDASHGALCGTTSTRDGSLDDHIPEPVSGVRELVWLEGRHLHQGSRHQAFSWVWLLLPDGRVHALCIGGKTENRDDRLREILPHLDDLAADGVHELACDGHIWRLPDAPVIPNTRDSVSWGHPVQRKIRSFAAHLDATILDALGELELAGWFFGSVKNYNALTLLPEPVRSRRLQALAIFPPLIAPLLLDSSGCVDLFGPRQEELWPREPRPTDDRSEVLDAVDRGRDLIGSLASYYHIDRALVRSKLSRNTWKSGSPTNQGLQLLRAIPAHARPRSVASYEQRSVLLRELGIHLGSPQDVERLARAFRSGWDETWDRLDQRYRSLPAAFKLCGEFLRSALHQIDLPSGMEWVNTGTLALAWIARRGFASMLAAAKRWRRHPAAQVVIKDGLPDQAIPLFDELNVKEGSASDISTKKELGAEGMAMKHCVGWLWEQCLLEACRFVHLQLPNGSTATAQYTNTMRAPDYLFVLTELRGPCNRTCGNRIRELADKVCFLINGTRLHERRELMVQHAINLQGIDLNVSMKNFRLLDLQSVHELHVALEYCSEQPDWTAS